MENVVIQYRFTLPDGSEEFFDLQIDGQNLELLGNTPDILPSWTNLDFNQCPHCPLAIDTHPHCPFAANLVNIVQPFSRLLSYERVHVHVVTEVRSISQDASAEEGIGSLMGLVSATSGCPHTALFKPLARFHLPFAGQAETIFRVASMHLLGQYFRRKAGLDADLALKGLRKAYEDVQVVNASVAARLRSATEKDSLLNAIVLLDMYAKSLSFAIDHSLEQIRYLFAPSLTGMPSP
jgi:hypothetical protein